MPEQVKFDERHDTPYGDISRQNQNYAKRQLELHKRAIIFIFSYDKSAEHPTVGGFMPKLGHSFQKNHLFQEFSQSILQSLL
jgi:hypothetical protein